MKRYLIAAGLCLLAIAQIPKPSGSGGGASTSATVTIDTLANLPATLNGTYACSTCPYTWFGTGGAPAARAMGFPVTVPPSAGWSSDNIPAGVGTSSVDSTYGAIAVIFNGGSIDLAGRYRTAPAAPWTAKMLAGSVTPENDNMGLAWGVRESSTGKIKVVCIGGTGTFSSHWTNSTTWSANTASTVQNIVGPLWIQLVDDSTNVIWKISNDGNNWATVRTEGRTTFATGDQIFVGVYSNAAADYVATVFSFSIS